MKKLKILLILLLIVIVSACSNNETYEPYVPEHVRIEGREGDALIWRVTSDTATVYLVGTIHVGLENLYPMQQILLDAFYRSDIIAVEINSVAMESSMTTMIQMAEMMMLQDGTTIEDHISSETMEMLEEFKDYMGLSALERLSINHMTVSAASMTLMAMQMEEWGFMEVPGVDHFFIELAHEIGKEVIEAESWEFQLELMLDFSPELQELLLRDLLTTSGEEGREYMEKMFNIWLEGDAVGLRNLIDESNEEFRRYSRRLFEEYNTAMMLNRDIAMTELIVEMLSGNQTVFFAVGAAHMVAENGIIDLLEEKGWTVTRVQQ